MFATTTHIVFRRPEHMGAGLCFLHVETHTDKSSVGADSVKL